MISENLTQAASDTRDTKDRPSQRTQTGIRRQRGYPLVSLLTLHPPRVGQLRFPSSALSDTPPQRGAARHVTSPGAIHSSARRSSRRLQGCCMDQTDQAGSVRGRESRRRASGFVAKPTRTLSLVRRGRRLTEPDPVPSGPRCRLQTQSTNHGDRLAAAAAAAVLPELQSQIAPWVSSCSPRRSRCTPWAWPSTGSTSARWPPSRARSSPVSAPPPPAPPIRSGSQFAKHQSAHHSSPHLVVQRLP